MQIQTIVLAFAMLITEL